jgi:hypothetical protein
MQEPTFDVTAALYRAWHREFNGPFTDYAANEPADAERVYRDVATALADGTEPRTLDGRRWLAAYRSAR